MTEKEIQAYMGEITDKNNLTGGVVPNQDLVSIHELLRRIARNVEDKEAAQAIRGVAKLLIGKPEKGSKMVGIGGMILTPTLEED
jgi:hypothetical protein